MPVLTKEKVFTRAMVTTKARTSTKATKGTEISATKAGEVKCTRAAVTRAKAITKVTKEGISNANALLSFMAVRCIVAVARWVVAVRCTVPQKDSQKAIRKGTQKAMQQRVTPKVVTRRRTKAKDTIRPVKSMVRTRRRPALATYARKELHVAVISFYALTLCIDSSYTIIVHLVGST